MDKVSFCPNRILHNTHYSILQWLLRFSCKLHRTDIHHMQMLTYIKHWRNRLHRRRHPLRPLQQALRLRDCGSRTFRRERKARQECLPQSPPRNRGPEQLRPHLRRIRKSRHSHPHSRRLRQRARRKSHRRRPCQGPFQSEPGLLAAHGRRRHLVLGDDARRQQARRAL